MGCLGAKRGQRHKNLWTQYTSRRKPKEAHMSKEVNKSQGITGEELDAFVENIRKSGIPGEELRCVLENRGTLKMAVEGSEQ